MALLVEAALISAFTGCVITAAISDVRTLRVPNRLCAVIALLFVAYAMVTLDALDVAKAVAVGAVTLSIGFVMFARGLLGGGDAKLLAAAALWAGPSHALELFAVTSLAGGALALALGSPYAAVLTSGWQQHWQQIDGNVKRRPMPYAVAIAAGALTVAAQLLAG